MCLSFHSIRTTLFALLFLRLPNSQTGYAAMVTSETGIRAVGPNPVDLHSFIQEALLKCQVRRTYWKGHEGIFEGE